MDSLDLDIDDLRVESFSPTPENDKKEGTVHGMADTRKTDCDTDCYIDYTNPDLYPECANDFTEAEGACTTEC